MAMTHRADTFLKPQTYASWSGVLPGLSFGGNGVADWREGVCRGLALAPRGAGRSFGDAAYGVPGGLTCLAPAGGPFDLQIDEGLVWVDAGDSVGSLHRRLEALGHAFAIYGGTQWATVGGAAAGDIHGKNHVRAGSFGRHVRALDLLLASGETVRCSRSERPSLFNATLGGMGLTGLIVRLALEVRPTRSRAVHVRRRQLKDRSMLPAALWPQSSDDFAFVAFFDLARASPTGLAFQARFSSLPAPPARITRRIPLPRVGLITPTTVNAIGDLVTACTRHPTEDLVHVRDFNYSGVHEHLYGWNALFGPRGMIEYQFAAPRLVFPDLVETFVALARSHRAPMLAAVIKPLGALTSGGLLSFPLEGATLNFQTPWSPRNLVWLEEATEAVISAGGTVNLTKDCCLRPDQLARVYPGIDAWRRAVRPFDPQGRIQTALGRRLSFKPWAADPQVRPCRDPAGPEDAAPVAPAGSGSRRSGG